jgi:hypothetical protein
MYQITVESIQTLHYIKIYLRLKLGGSSITSTKKMFIINTRQPEISEETLRAKIRWTNSYTKYWVLYSSNLNDFIQWDKQSNNSDLFHSKWGIIKKCTLLEQVK